MTLDQELAMTLDDIILGPSPAETQAAELAKAEAQADIIADGQTLTLTAGSVEGTMPLATAADVQTLLTRLGTPANGTISAMVEPGAVRSALGLSASNLDAQLASIAAGNLGSGSVSVTITCEVVNTPVDGVACWITTDLEGQSVVAGTRHSDTLGKVTFMLDPGVYYLWRQAAGYNFTNPQTITVHEPG